MGAGLVSVTSQWGWWRVTVDGIDYTNFRGAPAQISFQLVEPFGCGPGTLVVPALSPLEDLDDVDDRSFHYGAPVDIYQLHPDGSTLTLKWAGSLGRRRRTIDSTKGRIEWTLIGDMEEAGSQLHQPPMSMDPTDIGEVIAAELNGVVGRRFSTIGATSTGIETTNRGSDDQTKLAYVQELLAVATTDDGTGQWTVRRISGTRGYEIVLKDRTSVDWSCTLGGIGVQPSIELDEVPTRWFGQGVNNSGGWWGNWKYPGSSADDAPAYPNHSAGNTLSLGDSDSDTDSGTGVSDYQRRINDLNLTPNVSVNGVLGADDIRAVKEIQEHYGLLVDGIIGPQTWTATFNVGGGATLGTPIRLPLGWISQATPRIYNADGSDAGANPNYDPDGYLTRDIDINFGSGVSRSEGRTSIKAQLARDWPAGHMGDLVLRLDPEEGSKFDIAAGDNIQTHQLGAGSVLFHIAGVQVDCDRQVSLAIDQKARDLLSFVQIRQRNKENSVNPARLPKSKKARRSTQTHDAVVPFDSESPAGKIPRFAIYGGLWSVIHIPVSQSGRLAKVIMESTSPASKWAMAFFGAKVTPAQLNSWVGNPFATQTHDYDGPWDNHADDMRDAGLIEAWGSASDACGLKKDGTTIDGKFKDEGSLTYQSTNPPWMWIAVRSPNSTFLSGRVYPAPLDA